MPVPVTWADPFAARRDDRHFSILCALKLWGWSGVLLTHELLEKMRGRVEQCRRLARGIADGKTAGILLKMANDIEADIKRIEAEQAGTR